MASSQCNRNAKGPNPNGQEPQGTIVTVIVKNTHPKENIGVIALNGHCVLVSRAIRLWLHYDIYRSIAQWAIFARIIVCFWPGPEDN